MTHIAVVGAGPYGLSLAAHLSEAAADFRIFGKPMDTWREHMPAGMDLKSDGFASSLSDPTGVGTLAAYCAERGIPYHPTDLPVSLQVFVDYATEFQRRFVPGVEGAQVVRIDLAGDSFVLGLDSGEALTADVVVLAAGITHFGHVPAVLSGLPRDLVSHSGDHADLSRFAGTHLTVIGAGSSAVDFATLAAEAGARTTLVARTDALRFFSAKTAGPRTCWQRVRRPSSGLGPGWRSWLCQRGPGLFRYLPGRTRLQIVTRHLGPKSAHHMRARLEASVTVRLAEQVERAEVVDGRVRLGLRSSAGALREWDCDHVVAATGYYPAVSALPFLSPDLRAAVRTRASMAVLSPNFETSVNGLYVIGPAAVDTFGPLMRFMVGAEYVAPRLARHLTRLTRAMAPERAPAGR